MLPSVSSADERTRDESCQSLEVLHALIEIPKMLSIKFPLKEHWLFASIYTAASLKEFGL